MRARGPVGHTCPLIDQCIAAVESAIAEWEDAGNLHDLVGRTGLLEQIRSANGELRDWGAAQEDRANELDGQVSDLENQVDSLKDEVADLSREVERLAREADSLERQLSEVSL